MLSFPEYSRHWWYMSAPPRCKPAGRMAAAAQEPERLSDVEERLSTGAVPSKVPYLCNEIRAECHNEDCPEPQIKISRHVRLAAT